MMEELTKEQKDRLWEGKCADCDGELLEGPHGGCSINCIWDTCGNKFNVCMHIGTFAERI